MLILNPFWLKTGLALWWAMEPVLFLPEAASSFAEILCKYVLESKATTPNSPCCLLNWFPTGCAVLVLSFMVLSLSVLSFLLHRVGKDVSVTFLNCLWSGCTMMPAANAAGAEACASRCLFSKDSRHWFGLPISDTKPNIPFATMLITSSFLCLSSPLLFSLLTWKLKEYQEHLGTGKMFTQQINFTRDPCNSLPHSTWTFDSWRCAKGKDVKLQSSCPEEGVVQTYKEMTIFSSFTINTFNSLAERQAKFKIVHIWKLYHTLC